MIRRVALGLNLHRLRVFRPATIDLVLTKMARADEQDMADIRFLFLQEVLTEEIVRTAFQRARIPDVPEIRDLFVAAQPKVLRLASKV
jgi:hypothetical protein